MTREQLKQFNSMMAEIMEEERRRDELGAYSLFGDDSEALEKYRDELRSIRAWIGQIPDSLTRRAFMLRYVDGLAWCTVSCRLGYGSESGARVLCERYLRGEREAM